MRNTLIAVIIIGVGGLLVWQLYFSNTATQGEQSVAFSFTTATTTATTTAPVTANIKRYENKKYGIAFSYPKEFTVSVVPETETLETILIKSGEKKGIQIAISAFDEKDTVLTKQRILADVPDLVIEHEQAVAVDGRTAGISFESTNASFGKTAEIWFVHGGYLFQVTTYLEDKGLLREIIGTLKFI